LSKPKAQPPQRKFHRAFPVTMLVLAALIAAAFGVCHLLGAREDVSLVFATSGSGSDGARGGLLLAGLYFLSYFAFWLVMPVLLLAAGLFTVVQLLWLRAVARRQ
jgi:hypothetical protein